MKGALHYVNSSWVAPQAVLTGVGLLAMIVSFVGFGLIKKRQYFDLPDGTVLGKIQRSQILYNIATFVFIVAIFGVYRYERDNASGVLSISLFAICAAVTLAYPIFSFRLEREIERSSIYE
jgi:hypothetical protein